MQYLFIRHSYGNNLKPQLTIHKTGADSFEHITPTGKTLTLSFDTAQRFCTGWHDLATSESFPCPENAELPAKFNQCRHCQNKTGFNPAFYNASSISPQQQARNAQPHFLYLAHFAPGVVKVGISHAARGIRRLLDQGARGCLIIKTYPTATVARQYEAKASKLSGFAETLQVKTKHSLLAHIYDSKKGAKELVTARQRLADECKITPDKAEPIHLDNHYSAELINSPIILNDHKISGRCQGMIGSTLLFEQNGQQFGLCVSNLAGYPLAPTEAEELNTFQPRQASLF